MEAEISNHFGINRQPQHYQRDDYPARGQKPKLIIVGDSITLNILRKEIDDVARSYPVLVKSFPGATVEKDEILFGAGNLVQPRRRNYSLWDKSPCKTKALKASQTRS